MIELWLNAGLGNRMRLLASALALSRAAEQQLTVYWFNNSHLNCRFDRLFEPLEGVRIRKVETERLRFFLSASSLRYQFDWRFRPHDLFLGNEQIKRYLDDEVDMPAIVAGLKRCIIFTFYPFCEATSTLQDLRPKKELLAEADRVAADLGAGNLIGVHIRGTDNTEALEKSPVESFVERMKQEVQKDPEARFFLATDDPATEQTVTRSLGGRVVTRPKEFARDKAEGVCDALVDMLVLSRCRLILGSHWSSFTDIAAELDGAKLEIVSS